MATSTPTIRPQLPRVGLLSFFEARGTNGAVELPGYSGDHTFHCHGKTSAGAGAATITIEGSNDGVYWVTIATHTLTLGTAVTGGHTHSTDRFAKHRATVSGISGTGAEVTCSVSY